MMWEFRGNCDSLLWVEGRKLQNIKTGGFYMWAFMNGQILKTIMSYLFIFIEKLQNVDQRRGLLSPIKKFENPTT